MADCVSVAVDGAEQAGEQLGIEELVGGDVLDKDVRGADLFVKGVLGDQAVLGLGDDDRILLREWLHVWIDLRLASACKAV